jgi:Gpi18-like mannosyltransferase
MIGIQISKIVLLVTHMPPGSLQWLNGPLITVLFRIPAIICDFFIAGFLYVIIKKITKNDLKSYLGMALFLCNPIVIFNSTYKGQMDAIVNIFFIASLYFLFTKKILPSMVMFLCSLYIKLSLIYFIPVLAILWWKQISMKRYVVYGGITVVIGLCLLLPIHPNPFFGLGLVFKNSAIGEMANITAYAFNMWWMLFRPFAIPEGLEGTFGFSTMHLIGSPLDSTKYFGIPLFWYAVSIFVIVSLPMILRIMKKNISTINIIKNLSIIALMAFLVLPRMHERYMYPMFPLLTILAVQSSWYMTMLVVLSLLNLMNIYIVWHPAIVQFFPYTLWGQRDFQWMISTITVIVACVYYRKVIFSNRKEHSK